MTKKINENLLLTGFKFIKQKEFWLNRMAGEIAETKLLFDNKTHHGLREDNIKIDIPFPEHLCGTVVKLGRQSDIAIYIILLAALKLLLYRYGGNDDITVLSPVYQEFISDETMNDYVFIRDRVKGDATFKELLLQCKQSVIDAYENQDYPHERLLEVLFEKSSERGNRRISNVICALKNIHNGSEPEKLNDRLIFLFNRGGDRLEGSIFFAPGIYDGYYIAQILRHFITLLGNALQDIEGKILQIPLMSREEKERLIRDFNDTEVPYPTGRTIHQSFEEQAARTPDGVALVGDRQGAAPPADKGAVGKERRNGDSLQLTYRELNKRSDLLAYRLKEKGVGPDTIVGIMVERSLEMIVGLLGILKSGGAYLPIDPDYPQERIDYILRDSGAKLLITTNDLEAPDFPFLPATGNRQPATSLAYVIYTSGSTGKPKGVVVEHRNAVNVVTWFGRQYNLQPYVNVLQMSEYTFDASVNQIFGSLLHGAALHVINKELLLNVNMLREYIVKHRINLINFVPVFLNELLCKGEKLKSLNTVLSGAEKLEASVKDKILAQGYNLYNQYGPTETTIDALTSQCTTGRVTLGKPISNVKCYIFDKGFNLSPIGVTGELYVSGAGVARGYLNRPELTAEKFITNPLVEGFLYRTGDLGRWLPDGNIDFLGRIDHQVKIRGYRIELGGIENLVKKHNRVKDAVVVVKKSEIGDKYLGVYYISDTEIPVSELKEHLAVELPDYMIPSFFVHLEKMPLTPNGKINRRLLESREVKVKTAGYIAPRNGLEKALAKIWAEVLGIKEKIIGIDNNFFELGGHSLKATVLASEIHRVFNVKIPLRAIFDTPTLRGFVDYIGSRTTETFTSIQPVEKKQYYPLSSVQKRQYILQRMHPGSTSYNMPTIIYPDRSFNKRRLEETFRALIKRHESFRTSFNILEEKPAQIIHEDVDFAIEYYDLTGDNEIQNSKFNIQNSFIHPFDLGKAPLLRVGLINTPGKITLLVDMHHIIADGASHDILREEFQTVYEGKQLPALRLQYKDYAEWQNSEGQQALIKEQEDYWLNVFGDEPPVLNLPTDFPRPLMQSFEGSTLIFLLTVKETRALRALAKEIDATLYMSILSVFTILLSRLSGQEDIIVGTAIMGRRHADLKGIIGMFVNTLAMRNTLPGEKRYEEFLKDLKERTLAAYENQEYPFEELADRIAGRQDTGRNPVFDVMFNLLNDEEYRGDIPGLDEEDSYPYRHRKGTSKFDLTLTAVDRGERLLLAFEYCTRLFEAVTIERFVNYFKKIVSSIVPDPGIKLGQVEIISGEEKKQVLYDFNDSDCQYPGYNTVQRLFARQVERSPGGTALVGNGQLTYKELNRKSNQLARLLRDKGVTPNTIVGIMAERSIEMIVGMFAVLKAGAAYFPIDTDAPAERIDYMIKDSGIKSVLSQQCFMDHSRDYCEFINLENPGLYRGEAGNSTVDNQPGDLVYMLFTSGSTGNPKGVLIEHGSVVNILCYLYREYPFSQRDVYLFKTPYIFDVSVSEIFGWFLGGGRLAVLGNGAEKDPRRILGAVKKQGVTHINFVPSMFNAFLEMLDGKTLEDISGLKYIFLAGEAIGTEMVKRFKELGCKIRLENIYGPTEGTVYASKYSLSRWEGEGHIPIGCPVNNVKLYILDSYGCIQPVGVVGELHLGGSGLARGYLNRPELTAERFLFISYKSYRSYSLHFSKKIYKTGDLARWLPDGNIEFLGRMDHQVKVRGVRIELGEIENRLLEHDEIKEALVLAKEDQNKDRYLCAYVVLKNVQRLKSTGSQTGEIIIEASKDFPGIKRWLSINLPAYMIPSFFVELDEIPLNSSGKIDKKSLPEPGIIVEQDYMAPGNEIERRLVDIWSGILNIDKEVIGVHSSFFDLGGHSLKAITLTARIRKELGVEIPLMEIFKIPSIKGLARYIDKSPGNKFEIVNAAEEREYYPLSTAQSGIFSQQQKEREAIVYNLPQILPLGLDIDRKRMTQTFKKLIKRHDSLRTSFQMVDGKPVQEVYPFDNIEFEIEYHDLTGENTNRQPGDIIDDFIRPFDLSWPPLLRAGLIKVEEKNHILLVDIHHIISDGVSGEILRKEFPALYDGEDPPPLRLQYKDYSLWQNSKKVREAIDGQKEFWLRTFAQTPPVLRMPLDFDRPAGKRFEGEIIYFTIESRLAGQLKRLEKQTGATLYMVLLSAYFILLSRYTNQEDIVVGSPVTGRKHADLQDIIGIFVNMMSIRTQPVRDKTYREFLEEVKTQVIDSMENQDYHFEELVVRLGLQGNPGRNPLFDVVFSMGGMNTGAVKEDRMEDNDKLESVLYEFERRLVPFDLIMGAVENNGVISMCLAYSTALFKRSTIEGMVEHFIDILRQAAESDDDIRLRDILISHNLIAVDTDIHEEDLEEFEF